MNHSYGVLTYVYVCGVCVLHVRITFACMHTCITQACKDRQRNPPVNSNKDSLALPVWPRPLGGHVTKVGALQSYTILCETQTYRLFTF